MNIKRDILFIVFVVFMLYFCYSGVSETLLISEIQVEDANKEIFNNVNYVMDITNVSKSEFKSMYTDISNALNDVIDKNSIDVTYNKNRFTSVFTSRPENVEAVKSILNSNSKSGYFNSKDGGRLSDDGGIIYKLTVSYKQNIVAKIFNAITPKFMAISAFIVLGLLVCYPSLINLWEVIF